MNQRKTRPGKALEQLVAAIERALAGNDKVTIESPKFLPDKVTGMPREHDVVITLSGSHHKTTIAIECRDRGRNIIVNDVESFSSKCRDTGVDQGIIVTPKGFSRPALTKAAHRGIRCLRLSEAPSFNWLLAAGLTLRQRKVLQTNWTFFPEQDLLPKPLAFSILSAEGDPIPTENLVAAAYREFQKIPESALPPGRGTQKLVFSSPGLLLRDDTSGRTYPVARAVAAVDWETTEEVVPFNLVRYETSPAGELLTDAAIVPLDLGSFKGKLMIVYKESEGGQVLLVRDPAPNNRLDPTGETPAGQPERYADGGDSWSSW